MKTVKITNKQSPFYGKEGLATKHYDTAGGDPVLAVYIDGNSQPNPFYQRVCRDVFVGLLAQCIVLK